MRHIAMESYRRGEEFARMQKEKDALKRKHEVEALFEEASKALKEMCAKEVAFLHNSSIDPYATSVPGVVYMKVDGELEVKALKKKDALELYVLSGGLYRLFTNLTDLGKILHEDDTPSQ